MRVSLCICLGVMALAARHGDAYPQTTTEAPAIEWCETQTFRRNEAACLNHLLPDEDKSLESILTPTQIESVRQMIREQLPLIAEGVREFFRKALSASACGEDGCSWLSRLEAASAALKVLGQMTIHLAVHLSPGLEAVNKELTKISRETRPRLEMCSHGGPLLCGVVSELVLRGHKKTREDRAVPKLRVDCTGTQHRLRNVTEFTLQASACVAENLDNVVSMHRGINEAAKSCIQEHTAVNTPEILVCIVGRMKQHMAPLALMVEQLPQCLVRNKDIDIAPYVRALRTGCEATIGQMCGQKI